MRIFRAYIIAAIVCISITTTTACIFIADENAKKISLGEESAVVVLNSSDEKLYDDTVNPLPALRKIEEAAKKAAGFAPPPISNIHWFLVNSEKIMS